MRHLGKMNKALVSYIRFVESNLLKLIDKDQPGRPSPQQNSPAALGGARPGVVLTGTPEAGTGNLGGITRILSDRRADAIAPVANVVAKSGGGRFSFADRAGGRPRSRSLRPAARRRTEKALTPSLVGHVAGSGEGRVEPVPSTYQPKRGGLTMCDSVNPNANSTPTAR